MHARDRWRRSVRIVSIAVLFVAAARVATAGSLDHLLQLALDEQEKARASQARIDALVDETDALLTEYRSTERQIESLRVYNAQVSKMIAAQEAEMADLDRQIGEATTVGREITPLMLRMLDALERFIELDVPFLLDERRERVRELRAAMDRADVSDSEKYRRLLEAYQIEDDFGRTIEAYRGTLDKDGERRTVDFLRIGRIALIYQTTDREEAGMWDVRTKSWKPLSASFRSELKKAFRIARKQAAPDLVRLPVPAPEDAR